MIYFAAVNTACPPMVIGEPALRLAKPVACPQMGPGLCSANWNYCLKTITSICADE
jgi:hypothetical protein